VSEKGLSRVQAAEIGVFEEFMA